MSDGTHLLIPFAASRSAGCREALAQLALPNLEKLLARMRLVLDDAGEDTALSMPHERALAREYGIEGPDGRIPWAAWRLQQAGRDTRFAPWARITPCHWKVGRDHVAMAHPQDLKLDADDSQRLLAAIQPYFEEDGIRLEYDAPTLWLARGEVFRHLATASLDRVVGRTIDPWIPRGAVGGTLRRLQQEMQMLLYTHEVNDQRVRGGLLPVNSFWVSGTGALPPSAATEPPAGLQSINTLRDMALLEDWPAWSAAWQQLDEQKLSRLLRDANQGRPVKLTLCGERHARTWESAPPSLKQRFSSLFGRQAASTLLEQL
jgi:hypothetical protein